MSQGTNEILDITPSYFIEYNENAFAIDYLSKHIETETFAKLSDASKQSILTVYQNMLIAKAKIDYHVLERKEATKTNYKLLKALQRHIDCDLSDLLASITPDYFSYEYTNGLKNQIIAVNTQRVDAIWSRNFISASLIYGNKSLPEYAEINQNFNHLNGFASYGLYIVRGGMEAAKLLKHTFSNHEFYDRLQISNWDRFKMQWGLRSQFIVNDLLLWGPVNALTFHSLRGFQADILTVSLFVADLFRSLYTYYQTQEYFNKLKEKLKHIECQAVIDAMEQDLESQLEKQRYLMAYQLVLIVSMVAIFGLLNYFLQETLKLQFMFWGSVVALVAQFFVNLIDFISELKTCEDDTQKTIIWFKLVNRVLLQTVLPALLLAFGNLFVSGTLVTCVLLALYCVFVRLSNDLNMLFEAWMKPSSEQNHKQLEALEQALKADPENVNLRYEWMLAYEIQFQQDNGFDIALANVKKDFWLLLAIGFAGIFATELVAAGFTLTVGIFLIASLISLGLAIASKAPSLDVTHELDHLLASPRPL